MSRVHGSRSLRVKVEIYETQKKKLKKTRIIIITTPPVVSVINEQKCHLQFTLGVIVVALHDIKKKKKKDFLFPVAATF